MQVTINGEARELQEGSSLQDMVTMLELNTKKVAIEHNMAIIPKSLLAETALNDGDTIEIVQFIGGG
jgi:thiamine biosynthesis protein ThiS